MTKKDIERAAYTVVWTYLGNYGIKTVEADTAFDAIEKVVGFFSDDFRAKGTAYAFNGEPECVREALIPKYRNMIL